MFTEMAGKRPASTDLNHDNWDDEERPEEAGTFKKATDDVMEKRIVKKAKRRLQNSDVNNFYLSFFTLQYIYIFLNIFQDTTRSAFGTFRGFKTTSTHASPFSFLASGNISTSTNEVFSKTTTNVNKSSTNNETIKTNENGTNKKENTEIQTSSTVSTSKSSNSDQEEQNIFKKSDYFAKLKGLNESVAQWIKTHVDANPFCILTPIFKDYENYLKEIETKHGSEIEKPIQTQSSDNKEINTDKKNESSPFGGTNAKSPFTSTGWKPEKSIFDNISAGSKSIFGKSENSIDTGKSIFSSSDQSSGSHKSVFGNIDQKSSSKSIFGNPNPEKNPFLSKPSTTPDKLDEQETKSDVKSTITTTNTTSSSFVTSNTTTFCFGQSSATNNTSTGFSFGR